MDITFSIFPKFFKELDMAGLAALAREVGLDTVNLVIRDGYWVEQDTLAEDAPTFVKTMAEAGLKVRFATAGFSARAVVEDPDPVKILADAGITEFRLGYFRLGKDVEGTPANIRAALDGARRDLEAMCPVLEKIGGIRAVYQIHHGTLVPSPSGVYHLIKGLPPEQIGVMLDPGNQAFEGFEKWNRSCALLGDYLAAFGVKDVALTRDESRAGEEDKGWGRDWVTLDEGVTNWYDLVRSAKAVGFAGTFVWMPFYDADDTDAMKAKLKREVDYLRKVVADIASE